MPDAPKAASISVKNLSEAMEKSVTEILAVHKLQPTKGLAFGPGTLIGRQLKGAVTDLATIEQAAAELTSQIGRSMVGAAAARSLKPAASIQGGHIIVGFIAQVALLQE